MRLRPRYALFALLLLAWWLAVVSGCAPEQPIPAASLATVTGSPGAEPIATAILSGLTPTAGPLGPPAETHEAAGKPLALGPGLHDFTLPDAHGSEVTLSQYLGEKVVILTFYRAWW